MVSKLQKYKSLFPIFSYDDAHEVEDNECVQSYRYMRDDGAGIIFHNVILTIEVLFSLFLIFWGKKTRQPLR